MHIRLTLLRVFWASLDSSGGVTKNRPRMLRPPGNMWDNYNNDVFCFSMSMLVIRVSVNKCAPKY